MKISYLYFVFSLICAAVVSSAHAAASPVPQATVFLESPRELGFCLLSSAKACSKMTIPANQAELRQVISGNFVNTDGASWISLSDRTSSLCAFSSQSKGIICKPIASQAYKGVRITALGNKIHFTSSGDETGAYDETRMRVFGTVFVTALKNTIPLLQAEINLPKRKLIGPVGDGIMAMAAEGDGGVCDEGGGGGASDCVEDGGGPPPGGIAPGDGGSSGEGGTGSEPGGQVVIVWGEKNPPVAPPDVVPQPPSTSITLCGTFGISCNDAIPDEDGLYEERVAACEFNYEVDIDLCNSQRRAMDSRTYAACTSRAADRLAACLMSARRK